MRITGHRGAPGPGRYGENTMTSFCRAIYHGADEAETDVRRAGCETLVLLHDETIDRTTNGTGFLRDFTYEELLRFDAGFGDHIPSLREACAEIGGRINFNFELKERGLVPDVCEMLARYGLSSTTVISCFDRDDFREKNAPSLRELASVRDPVKRGIIVSRRKFDVFGAEHCIASALKIGATRIHIAKERTTPRFVRRAHDAGLEVMSFTVNSRFLKRCFEWMGVDGIFTDFPQRFSQQ